MPQRRSLQPPLRPSLIGALIGALLLASCAGAGSSAQPSAGGQVTVVATSTVIGDLARQVGGERVVVFSLVPPGGEVHTFEPRPSDARRVSEAQLVLANGLGLDDWMAQLTRDAGAGDVPHVAVAEGLQGVKLIETEGSPNPHLWMNVADARLYSTRIADALARVDPAGKADYDAGAAAYGARLDELDTWARDQMAGVPAADRRVISLHDAFPYFAAAYGIEISGVVFEVPGQDPGAGEIARLVETIRRANVRAILAEAGFSTELAQRIAEETGVAVVDDLYTDSLGKPPVDTYERMIRWDVDRLVKSLAQ
jgi:ABC-type Zn uptake system ZnuABC Zn-binding protein ZnuA